MRCECFLDEFVLEYHHATVEFNLNRLVMYLVGNHLCSTTETQYIGSKIVYRGAH